ncbi:hypothetical protein ASZ90_000085 [hydrocarbon metagenome]|uniref:Uncharacterized protein n=1 Tax=hydrocarbon metagenome TaxID=938273 RepID=A0A0W8GBH9_9ZZZZ
MASAAGPLAGSSPRARGTPGRLERMSREDRIIPASAGNTPSLLSCPRQRSDHPRERGEHSSPWANASPGSGSSPRARGTHLPPAVHSVRVRIIPASAGNTFPSADGYYSTADHPRERGEH